MNRAPLNAIAINGNILVRGSAVASLALSGALTANVRVRPSAVAAVQLGGALETHATPAMMGSGHAGIEAHGGAVANLHMRPEAVAGVAFNAASDVHITPATFGEAEPKVEVEGSMWGTIHFRPDLHANVAFDASVISHSVFGKRGSGLGLIEFLGDLEPTIHVAPKGEGRALLRIASRLQGTKHRSHRPRLDSSLWMTAKGGSTVHHKSAHGEALIRLLARGSGRLGAKLYGEGRARVSMRASMSSSIWRHVHGSGSAVIRLSAWSQIGLPPIPTEYVEAHPMWQFKIGREDWRFVIPKEQRRLP